VSGPGGSEAQSAKMSGEPDRLWDRNLRAPVCGTGDPMWDLEEISNQKRGETLWIFDPGIEYHIGWKSYHEISAKA
jgi:hypothetical protein